MLVFREGRRLVAGPTLYREFASTIADLGAGPSPETLLGSLLESGELECALADAHSVLANKIGHVTDALADSLIGGTPVRIPSLSGSDHAELPRELSVSRPEGFAYYALHPLSYADAVESLILPSGVAVIGIRSIGATLSAVVASAARQRGAGAQRITVRPEGHPWDRKLHLDSEQQRWVQEQLQRGAQFLIVDEGPGLSGSSFLSVGEALALAGIPLQDIFFLCSVAANAGALRARDAAERWNKFKKYVVNPRHHIFRNAEEPFVGGKWRESLTSEWPGSWTSFERLKFSDGNSLFKFEGLGAYGNAAVDRAKALAAAGFSPAAQPAGDGFVRYDWLQGEMPQRVSGTILDRIAEYCAWRVGAFAMPEPTDLSPMVTLNCAETFGLQHDPAEALPVKRVVIPDGKMQPYEWLETNRGLLKLDSADHGDDHFFPGPADIAWDLAGAIIEWNLDALQSEHLLSRYAQLSGDAPQDRIAAYLSAYALFRHGYCRMAAESLQGTDEEKRLSRDAARYRAAAQACMQLTVAA